MLLDLAAEFQGVGDFVEWLGRAAGSDDDDGAVAEHSAEEGLSDFDGFHFVQQHFDGLAAGESRLDNDAVIGDGHFRCVAADHADENCHDAADEQHGAADLRKTEGCGLKFLVGKGVVQQKRSDSEQQRAEDYVAEHNDPVEPCFVDHCFAGNEVFFDVAHRDILAKATKPRVVFINATAGRRCCTSTRRT